MGKETVKISRRRLLRSFGAFAATAGGGFAAGGLTAGGLAGLASSPASAKSASHPVARADSLYRAAARAGLLFGASASKEIFANPAYADLYRTHARVLTTDVALKFDYIRWREDQWDFAEADRLLTFCRRNDKLLRGHALIWNENAPPWLKGRSAREITRIFDEHIDRVVGRYRGALHSWDVVNEPFWPGHGEPGGYRTGPWFEAMGPSYVLRAFKRAARADPNARLVLNEAHCERDDEVGRAIRKNMLRLVDELLDAGVSLAAVGLQAHLQPEKPYSDKAFADFLWRLHERGVNIYLSEMDVRDEAYPADPRVRDQRVGARYGEFLGEALKIPSVKAVICWQLSDRYSWLRNMARQQNPHASRLPRPLPFDANLRPKPACNAMLHAFRERRV